MKDNLLLGSVFIMFSIIIGCFSLIIWRTPILLIMPSLEVYLIPEYGSPIAYGLVAWFLLGGYRTAIVLAWDRHESYFGSPVYILKTSVLVLFAFFIQTNRPWPPLHETLQHIAKK